LIMAKKWLGLIESLTIFALVLVLLFCPVYTFIEPDESGVTLAYFPFAIASGANNLTLFGGIALFLFLPLASFKLYIAFRWPLEREEEYSFFLYLIWGLLAIVFFVAAGAASSWIAFTLGLLLGVLALVFFALDYHFYGQN
jgi:hypothetical protein